MSEEIEEYNVHDESENLTTLEEAYQKIVETEMDLAELLSYERAKQIYSFDPVYKDSVAVIENGVITSCKKCLKNSLKRRLGNEIFLQSENFNINFDVIKITVNKLPERLDVWKTRKSFYLKEIKEYWQGNVLYALKEIQQIKQYKKVVVFINLVSASGKYWDIDNHNIKYIIDAIKYQVMDTDDTFENVKYMVAGQTSKDKNYTEIYVMEECCFMDFLSKRN
jgi:hypothetical protein